MFKNTLRYYLMGGAVVVVALGVAFWAGRSFSSTASTVSTSPASEPAPQVEAEAGSAAEQPEFPSPEQLQRLAASALRRTGVRSRHNGPVKLGKQLADGSFIVSITLEDGRSVSGRLFRDRMRYRITIDKRDLFSHEIVVKTQSD